MLDRFGKRIAVGWAEHEIVWLKAAMTLPRTERWEAYQDISDLTGRTFAAVTYQAQRLECARQEDALKCIQRTTLKARGCGEHSIVNAAGSQFPIRPCSANPRGRDRASMDVRPIPPTLRTAFHGSSDLSGGLT